MAGRRPRLSVRVLAAVVAVFSFVGLAMIGLLLAVIALDASSPIQPAPAEASTPPALANVDSRSPESALARAGESESGIGWGIQNAKPSPGPLLAKSIVGGEAARPRWTATPVPTNTPTPSPTPNPTFVSSAYGLGSYMPDSIGRDERWIDVDLTEQKLVAYEGLVPVFETLISSGTARYPTVTGQFRIWLRFRAQDMDGYRLGYDYYLRDVPFVQYFFEDYALHGTFWHSNFGQPMSHGCVNLATADAEWLYEWAGYGTLVNIHP